MQCICDAIRARRLLAFEYEGHRRVAAPYCHGFNRGGEMLRAVQVGGSSRSGRFGVGKLWSIAKMREIRVVDESFVPDDPDYNPDDTAMARIHCRVWLGRVVGGTRVGRVARARL
jgi:hypothetical protein